MDDQIDMKFEADKDEEGNFKLSDFFASMQTGDKAAVLMVHFGTTYDETRALTIDAINEKAREAFEGTEVREAYTSRIIMRRLKARGIEKLNPAEALTQLKAEGFTDQDIERFYPHPYPVDQHHRRGGNGIAA